MERIGERLRIARESKKLSIRDVVKETNISQQYVEALEDEEFDRFPGETYLIGFLKSYSEYLKLDPDEMVQAYKGYKIGESATPLEELTKPTNSGIGMAFFRFYSAYKNFVFAGAVAVSAFLIIWGVMALFSPSIDLAGGRSIDEIRDEYNLEYGTEITNVRPLQFRDDRGHVLVYRNEAVQFLVDKKEVVFILKDIIENDDLKNAVKIEMLPDRRIETLHIGSSRIIEIDGVNREVRFSLRGLTKNRAQIVVLLGAEDKTAEVEPDIPKGDFTTVSTASRENLRIVFDARFTDRSYMEVYLDGSLNTRTFMREGARERWEASENIQVKIGNAGGVEATINGRRYTFGGPGQVANKVITWEKDINNPNVYHIVIRDW